MEIYEKKTITKEELEEDEFSNVYGTNETTIELLNTLKEVFELTEYTSKEKHESIERVIVVNNELTDKEIINIALYNFLELITAPSGINFLIGADPEELENLEYASVKRRIENLINSTIDSILLNLDTKGTVTSSDYLLKAVKEEVEADKEKEKQFRKDFLKSRKEEIEKELAELESN